MPVGPLSRATGGLSAGARARKLPVLPCRNRLDARV